MIQEWESNVMPTHKELVEPGVAVANLVVSGASAVGEIVQRILDELMSISLPDPL